VALPPLSAVPVASPLSMMLLEPPPRALKNAAPAAAAAVPAAPAVSIFAALGIE
jgi:hypothetical protein